MARRKSSRGRVFYYPSSLPKMQDGDKLPTNQSEYEDVLGVIKEYRGYKPSDVNEVLNKIAWHESALSMDPTKKQELNDGSFGKGRGLYQFEPDALTTAINSTKNLYTNAGKEIPDWVKSIDTKDASILPASQQSALAAASMIQRENFIFDKALKSDEGLTEAWGKGWQTKNDPKKKELFKKHLESYYTKKEESPATFYSVYEEPGANIKPNPNLRTREEILSMLVGRDYTRTPKESSYNPQQRLIKDIMDENKALYKVGNPKDFNIIPADERMTQHLEKTGRGLEYLDAKDTWIPFKDRPTAKLRIPGEGANRVVINTEDIDPKELKEAVALDFISHSMDEDKTYRKYKDKINTELVNKYGQEFIDRNGGIDAYVRGIIADRNNPEYQPYKEETAFLNKSLVNDFKKYIKTGEKPSKGLFNFRYGGGITGNNDESNGLIPVRVDVANKSTTWNPKFTDIINNPSNYSQAEVIDAIQKMSALFPDSDKIITTPGVSPSEAGIRYVEPDPATGLPKLKNGGIPDRYKNKGFTKVGAKKQSTRPGKKWMVLAKKGDDYKVVHGGYKGMKDFSQHGSEDRKKKFWSRMGGKDSAKAKDPFSPLYWHKRFGTWEYGGDIQKQGYKDNSPYKNRRYIDIYSNNITMDGVSQPLQVTTDKGQQMVLPPNSGEYYFPNADAVRETPLVDLPSYFSGSKINLTKYEEGGAVSEEQVENEPNNQVIDEYIQNLMDQENAARVGFDPDKGLWFPHQAPEQGGGFDIGYGHKIKQGEDFSRGLTDDEVLELLASDLAVKMDSAARKFNQKNYNRSWDTLTPEEQILLTDYEYNVGVSKFPKLMEAIANQDIKTMLEQYKRYSGGKPLTSRNNWTKTFIEDKIVRSPIKLEAENLETKNATPIDNKIPSNVILNAFTNSQTQDIERKGLDTIPNLIQNNSNLEKIAQAPYPIREEQLGVLDEKQYTLDNTVLPVVGNPFEGKGTFRRPKQPQEKRSALYDAEGKQYQLLDFFDKKTGKKVGTWDPVKNQVIEEYQNGGSLPKYQNGKGLPDKADSEVYRLYLSGKHLKQGYPDAEQSGTGRLYPDAKEVSPNFEYEGDKHWNTKRFAYAPFFNKIETDGYHYRTNDGGTAPLDLPKGDKARKKMLIGDMTTYFKASGYSDEEANQKAKNYVKKEVMPLVNSKWDKQHDKGKSSIGRVDQFDAPQLYNYVDSKGEKKLKKLFYNKKENKRLNEGYIQSPKKLKRLDKDFNIKFRGLSKQDAKTEANFNYNNYKDKRYTVAQFKADKKLHGYQDGGSLPMYQDGDKIDYIKKQIKTIPQYFNPKTYSYNNEEGLNTIPNYNKHNSFDKAFKQAREDLGRGQTFLYNGKRYTTNKENEFPNDESETVFNTMTKTLSPEQKNKAKEYYFKQGAPKLILGVDDDKFAILPSAQVSFADLSPEDSRPHINPLGPSNKVYLQDYNFDYSDLLPEDRPKYDDDVRLLIDELAHIEQQRNMGTGPFFKDFLFDAIKGEVSKKSPYDTEGAIEHSAHEVIGPKRLKGIMGYRNGGQLPKAEIMIDPATGLPKLKSGGKTWIQEAIKKPGSLRATAKRAGAIKSDGTIKKIWLKEKAKGSGKTA